MQEVKKRLDVIDFNQLTPAHGKVVKEQAFFL
jgi:hypothetical protein